MIYEDPDQLGYTASDGPPPVACSSCGQRWVHLYGCPSGSYPERAPVAAPPSRSLPEIYSSYTAQFEVETEPAGLPEANCYVTCRCNGRGGCRRCWDLKLVPHDCEANR